MDYDILHNDLIGSLTLLAGEQGLRGIRFGSSGIESLSGAERKSGSALLQETKKQLNAYFDRRLYRFDLPLAPMGTPFQISVWATLRTIPYGQVVSYQWVAENIGNPNAVRAVGNANARNPLPIVVPCHRVIGSNGTLTGYAGGLGIKRRLIESEVY